MDSSSYQKDIDALAGKLAHRSPSSESELQAAQYLRDRFREYTPDVELDGFYAPDSQYTLFAAYFAEFFVVSLIALWWPGAALVYGTLVFVSYLAEFTGYRVLGRLLPHYESQNVMARFMAPEPRRLVIVTANYDTPKESLLSKPRVIPWLRTLHFLAVCAMVLVLATCAIEAYGQHLSVRASLLQTLRSVGVVYLLALAVALLYCANKAQPVPGANGNASGVSVLLELAQRLRDNPTSRSDVWLAATGSKEVWMHGMQYLISSHDLDPQDVTFLVVDHVGAGELRYVIAEGMLHVFTASNELIDLAEEEGPRFGATPMRDLGMPSETLIPLGRGYPCLRITATDLHGRPLHWRRRSDTVEHLDVAVTENACNFTEALLRRIDSLEENSGST